MVPRSRSSSTSSRSPTTSRTSTTTPTSPRKPTSKAGPSQPGAAQAGPHPTQAEAKASASCILGIDPGLASVGWGLVEARGGRLHHLAHGCITTSKDEAIGDRLRTIHATIEGLIREWRPGQAAMESLYFWKNVTSALPVAEAKGVIHLAFAEAEIDLVEYSPTAIKQAVTGSARAEKAQVQEMVRILLGLPEVPKPDHAADALAAAICRANHAGPLGAAAARGPSKAGHP